MKKTKICFSTHSFTPLEGDDTQTPVPLIKFIPFTMRTLLTGFTLVEILVVVTIIGILASIVLVSFSSVRPRARDAKRKAEVYQIGKFLTISCYLPDAGGGEYDLIPFLGELRSRYPQYGSYFPQVPKDPKTGTETESKYIYTVNSDGKKCALFANLENPNESATLTITTPTPGGGTGVLRAESAGWNGTPFYYQVSN